MVPLIVFIVRRLEKTGSFLVVNNVILTNDPEKAEIKLCLILLFSFLSGRKDFRPRMVEQTLMKEYRSIRYVKL